MSFIPSRLFVSSKIKKTGLNVSVLFIRVIFVLKPYGGKWQGGDINHSKKQKHPKPELPICLAFNGHSTQVTCLNTSLDTLTYKCYSHPRFLEWSGSFSSIGAKWRSLRLLAHATLSLFFFLLQKVCLFCMVPTISFRKKGLNAIKTFWRWVGIWTRPF